MKIETPQENKIVVELSGADMAELDITYEEMDYGNIETRRVIWTILDRVRHTLSRDIDPSGRMMIETIPTGDGGCVLYFTVLGEGRYIGYHTLRINKERTAFTYAFDSLDALTDCAAALRRREQVLPKSSLFLLDGEYRLFLQCDLPPGHCKQLLSEYGTLCAEGTLSLSFLREHGRLLCENNAIENLTIGL